ncbi:LLM class flavin-dependent oxidoreductase [Rhodococcus sp. WS4]|nr:LLM class flavin-dependent oxidoreductase [Rhodococcus sp. WS4]
MKPNDYTSPIRASTMEIDFYPGSGLRLDEAEPLARTVESSGIGGLWALEAAREPFGPLAVAALATTRLHLRTAVAVAFARNPMILAQQAHEQRSSKKSRSAICSCDASITRGSGFATTISSLNSFVGASNATTQDESRNSIRPPRDGSRSTTCSAKR